MKKYFKFIPLFFCLFLFSCNEYGSGEIYDIIGNRYYYIAYDEQENLEYYQIFYFTDEANVIFEEITKDLSIIEKPIYLKYTRQENVIHIKGEDSTRINILSNKKIRETFSGLVITYCKLTDQKVIDALNKKTYIANS